MKLPRLPDHCYICKDPIRLYRPYYTVRIKGHLTKTGDVYSGEMVLCPDCFNAYDNFVIERITQENHKRTNKEMRGIK